MKLSEEMKGKTGWDEPISDEQVEDWADEVAQLDTDLAKTTRAMQAAIDAGGMAMSENQRLTKHVEDYEAENAALKRKVKELESMAKCVKEGKLTEAEMHAHLYFGGTFKRDALLTAEEHDDQT